MASVQPFQFEPERTETVVDNLEEDDTEHEDDLGGEEARVGDNRWCLCNNCLPMLTERESVCCQELRFLTGSVQGEQMDQISVIV